ncbi:MAG: hypothetical protein ACTHKS_08395 [Gaiellaceae bacterium]
MRLRIAIGVGVAALSVAAAVARPLPAAAATPCWKALLNDWYDGRIDNTYPLHCYSDALKHLPADVQTYSSAHDDILRALQNAKAELKKSGTKITPNTPVPPAGKPPTKTTGHGKTGTTTTSSTTTQAPGRKPPGGGLPSAVDKVNHSSPSSIPLPLLVLGGLALLLIAAGGIGLIAKRRRAG